MALFCVGTASAFGWLLAYYQIPKAILENVTAWNMGPIAAGFFIAFVVKLPGVPFHTSGSTNTMRVELL